MPNEVQMVELNDGAIMLNARSYKGNHCRKIACSQDEGKTWSLSKTLVKGSFAYSCLVKLSDNEFGILFERDNYSKISFSRKRIDWLLS
jgi:sialidase-1